MKYKVIAKYKVTAKKKVGAHYINDWFKGELSHMGYFTDSINEAKKIIQERKNKKQYYSEDCEPQILLTNSGKEVAI